ncbi:hypothetical protein MTO96_044519 [Rhipicephalus appendiculatus]
MPEMVLALQDCGWESRRKVEAARVTVTAATGALVLVSPASGSHSGSNLRMAAWASESLVDLVAGASEGGTYCRWTWTGYSARSLGMASPRRPRCLRS